MTVPPTIAFDLDGTLVDTAPDLLTALNIVLAGEGLGPVSSDAIVGYVGRGARAMLARAYAVDGRSLSPAKHDALFSAFLAEYDRHIVDASRPFAGVEAMLDRFAAGGWRIAVCTNKYEAPARKLLDLLGLGPRFAVVAGQDTFGVSKPDPRHLTETVRLAGGSWNRAVMVGDSQIDIDTGRAAGVPVVAVTFGYSPVPVAELNPTAVIDHFSQLYDVVAHLDGSAPTSRA
jgi:phosphoglycolate phosphatase